MPQPLPDFNLFFYFFLEETKNTHVKPCFSCYSHPSGLQTQGIQLYHSTSRQCSQAKEQCVKYNQPFSLHAYAFEFLCTHQLMTKNTIVSFRRIGCWSRIFLLEPPNLSYSLSISLSLGYVIEHNHTHTHTLYL